MVKSSRNVTSEARFVRWIYPN